MSRAVYFSLSSVPFHLSEGKKAGFQGEHAGRPINPRDKSWSLFTGCSRNQLVDLFIVIIQNGGEILQNENNEHALLHSEGRYIHKPSF